MIKLSNTILFTMILTFTSQVSIAQKKQEESLFCRILTFSKIKTTPKIQYINPKNKDTTVIALHKNNFVGPYKFKSRTLAFYDGKKTVDNLGKAIGKVAIPQSLGKRVLLIALADGEKYRFIALKDNIDFFKKGEVILTNLTKLNIVAVLNRKPHKLAIGKTIHLKNLTPKQGHDKITTEFYLMQNNKPRVFSTGYWLHEPDVRKLTFVYIDPRTKHPRIKAIRDFYNGAKEEEELVP